MPPAAGTEAFPTTCSFSYWLSSYPSPYPPLLLVLLTPFFPSNFFLSRPYTIRARGPRSITWFAVYTRLMMLCLLQQVQIPWGSALVTHEIIHTAWWLCLPYTAQVRVRDSPRRIWVLSRHALFSRADTRWRCCSLFGDFKTKDQPNVTGISDAS